MSQTSYENLVDIVTSDKGTGTAAYQAINQASLSDLRQLTEEYDLDAIAETFPQPSDGAALATTAQIRIDKLDRNPDLFKAANGYYCDAESRLRAVKDCDDPELLQDALQSQSLQKTVRTAIERRLKKLSATQISGLKSQPSKDPEVMPPDEPSKAHADALQSIGRAFPTSRSPSPSPLPTRPPTTTSPNASSPEPPCAPPKRPRHMGSGRAELRRSAKTTRVSFLISVSGKPSAT